MFQETRLAIAKATTYLEGVQLENDSAHTVAIVAYALALADSPVKHTANTKLKDLASYDEGTLQ